MNFVFIGPLVKQTNGEIWPKPQVQAQEDGTFHTFDVENFSFEVNQIIFQEPKHFKRFI
jgi:hypothetical protein